MPPFAEGFALGLTLILAIGAQNLFVLRQGLKREHVFPICLTCGATDATLIALGIAGLGTLIAQSPVATGIAAWGGVTFLLFFGGRAFRDAFARTGGLHEEEVGTLRQTSVMGVIAFTLGFSLLNPHVWLDTVVILGPLGAQYPADARMAFAIGAITASFVFFFSLGYGARLLAPLFEKRGAQRGLDLFVGVVMWAIALNLAWAQF